MPRLIDHWRELYRHAERWILPPACLTCRAPVTEHSEPLVCRICRSRWRSIPAPCCVRCGEPTPLGLECRVCREWPPDFGPVRSAVGIDPAVRHMVHLFKYQGWHRLAEVFAQRMADSVPSIAGAELVPIPLAPRRRRERGYNQAEELALALGSITGLPVAVARLQRLRETPSQTRLTPENRKANLAEAFGAGASDRPAILVDDVFTTGSTLCSAASELLDSGASQVGAITFARAEGPLGAAGWIARRGK